MACTHQRSVSTEPSVDLVSGAGALLLPERADQPCETKDQQEAGESKG